MYKCGYQLLAILPQPTCKPLSLSLSLSLSSVASAADEAWYWPKPEVVQYWLSYPWSSTLLHKCLAIYNSGGSK